MVLRLDGETFGFFNSYSVNLHYNTVASTFNFSIYFDPENPTHKRLLKPLTYKTCTVEHKGELLITGTILSHIFIDAPVRQLISISGYSLPGVLEDCEIPTNMTLQTTGLSTLQIAQKLAKPFGIKVVADTKVANEVAVAHRSSTANRDESIRAYLSSITSQKNIILSHTPEGALLFTRANTVQDPIINFNRGVPGTEISLSIDGQDMHSSITVVKQADVDGGNAGQYTVNNPFVGAYRPTVKVQSSGNDNSTEKAAKNALARELKSIQLNVEVDRWEASPTAKVFRPNQMITVENPTIYLYNQIRWFIDSVSLQKDEKKETASLQCVLPCVYDGSVPFNIFE